LVLRLPAFRFPCFIFLFFAARVEQSETRDSRQGDNIAPGFRFAQSGLLAPSLIEPKPVLPPGFLKLRRDAIKNARRLLSVPCRKPRVQKTASRE
jgi:hypothetical protein